MTTVRIPANGWKPRKAQRKLWNYLANGGKRAIAIWHRRAGKDEIALNWSCVALQKRVGAWWHCLPEYAQARKAIWNQVNPHTGRRRIDEAFPVELRKRTLEHEMFIEFHTGSTWQVIGSDNYNHLVGASPLGVTFSEYAIANPAAWAYFAPILDENDGTGLFITTPRGKNHAYKTLQAGIEDPNGEWFAEILSVVETGYPLERVEKQRREYHKIFGEDAGDALIEQEYFCFPPGTPIWTDRGQRPIESIRIGDTVLSHAGRWRKVARLYEREHAGEMIEIHSVGSPKPLVCTPRHPVRICDPAAQEYRWVPACDVRAGQYVVLPRLRIQANPMMDEGLAALIGWFIAEGSVCKNAVQFALGDEPHVADRLSEAGKRFGKVSVSPIAGQKGLAVRINSTWLADFLTAHCGSGADMKHIPWALIAGHEKAVYEALIEGDGCRGDYSGVRDVFTTVSHSLALDVQMLAHMLGMRAAVSFRPKEKAARHFQGRLITIRDAYSVRVAVIRKNRKYYGGHTKPKILPQKHGVAALVRQVARAPYAGPVHNFAVQHDESYVAAGRVVHNCSFEAAILGSIYGREISQLRRMGRVRHFQINPAYPVHRAWDLGRGQSDAMSIWFFQWIGGEVRYVDYVEGYQHGIGWYAEIIKAKGYPAGTKDDPAVDWVPHDAKVASMELETTRIRFMIDCGLNPRLIPDHYVEDRHSAGRHVLRRAWFHPRCADALEVLAAYHYEYDEKILTFLRTPKHDFSSHAADAFGYSAVAWSEPKFQKPASGKGRVAYVLTPDDPEFGMTIPDRPQVTIEDLWQKHREQLARARNERR